MLWRLWGLSSRTAPRSRTASTARDASGSPASELGASARDRRQLSLYQTCLLAVRMDCVTLWKPLVERQGGS